MRRCLLRRGLLSEFAVAFVLIFLGCNRLSLVEITVGRDVVVDFHEAGLRLRSLSVLATRAVGMLLCELFFGLLQILEKVLLSNCHIRRHFADLALHNLQTLLC